jgi:hypothetical protein
VRVETHPLRLGPRGRRRTRHIAGRRGAEGTASAWRKPRRHASYL